MQVNQLDSTEKIQLNPTLSVSRKLSQKITEKHTTVWKQGKDATKCQTRTGPFAGAQHEFITGPDQTEQ